MKVHSVTWHVVCFRVSHAVSWKMMKPHVQLIVQDILFPLMCHSEQDEELWQTDPIEYIRIKYGIVAAIVCFSTVSGNPPISFSADVFEEFYSPSNAAQNFLFAAVKKRKEVLPKTMGFVMQVLTSQNLAPRQQAGALQIVGAVAEVLMTVSAVVKIFKIL